MYILNFWAIFYGMQHVLNTINSLSLQSPHPLTRGELWDEQGLREVYTDFGLREQTECLIKR